MPSFFYKFVFTTKFEIVVQSTDKPAD